MVHHWTCSFQPSSRLDWQANPSELAVCIDSNPAMHWQPDFCLGVRDRYSGPRVRAFTLWAILSSAFNFAYGVWKIWTQKRIYDADLVCWLGGSVRKIWPSLVPPLPSCLSQLSSDWCLWSEVKIRHGCRVQWGRWEHPKSSRTLL